MKKSHCISVEITDTHVKVLRAKKSGSGVVVTACVIRAIRDYTDDELVRILSETLPPRDVASSDLFVVIPRRLAIVRQMRVPSHNDREIHKMIGLQLVTQIPYTLGDIVYDYELIEKESTGYARVLVVVVHKEDVGHRFLKLFAQARLTPEKFVLSSLGLLGWLNYQEQKKQVVGKEPQLLISIDAAHAELCFCHDRKLLFARSVPYGAKDLGADAMADFFDQIKLSFKNYRQENMGPEVSRILVLSTRPEAADLKERLERDLKVSVSMFSSLENVLSQKTLDTETLKKEAGVSLGVCFGTVASDVSRQMNLIPAEVQTGKELKRKRTQKVQFALLLLLALVLGIVILGMQLYEKIVYLKRIDDKIATLGPQVEEARRKIDLIKSFRNEFEGRILVADMVRAIEALMPRDVSVRSISWDEHKRLAISGYAETSGSVNSFQTNLVRSPVFQDVSLEYATKRRIFNMDVTDFKITAQAVAVK